MAIPAPPPGYAPEIPAPPQGFGPDIPPPPSGYAPVRPPVQHRPRIPATVPPPPPSPLEGIVKPVESFVGGAYEAGKNLLFAPFQLGAGALSEAGLAVSALAGDAPSRKLWEGRLKGLHDTFSQDPAQLESEAGKLFSALVTDQVRKFKADPARYAGGAFLNVASQLIPGRILALRNAGKTAEAAALAAQAAEVEEAAKVRAATRASIAEGQAAPLATPSPPGTLVHEGTQGFRFPEETPPLSVPADPRKVGQIRAPAAIPEEPPPSVLTPEAEIARNQGLATARGLGRFLPPTADIAETGYVPTAEEMARNRAVSQGLRIARGQGRILRPGGGELRTPVVGRQEFVESSGVPIEPPPALPPRPRLTPAEAVEMRGSSGLPDLRAAAERLARAREIGGEPVRTPPPPRGPLGRLLGGRPGTPGSWQARIQQAMRADSLAHGLVSDMDAFNAETARQLASPEHALTRTQQRHLTDLLHTPQSPIHTGQWPEWVPAGLRRDLVRDDLDLARTYRANRRVEIPEETKLALEELVGAPEGEPLTGAGGHAVDAEGRPYFPRIELSHALEQEGIAGFRGFRGKGGARDFFEVEAPGGEKRLVAVGKGNTLLVRDPETGEMVAAGRTAKASGLEGSQVTLTQDAAGLAKGTTVTLHTPTPGTLRAAGLADYLDHPVWNLRHALKREKWLSALERWRREVTNGDFSDIARPKAEAPVGGKAGVDKWVKAPFLGPDWMVHPFLGKTIDRIRGMRAGDAKWNLLNNVVVGLWFKAFPWAHHPNILFNWTVGEPLVQALGLAKGALMETWREAAREVEEFGPKFQRMVELGGGRQHVEARLRQHIEQIMREAAQGPDAKRGLWKRYEDFTHAVPWSIDAKARLQTVLILERSGVPFDEAVGIANVKMPNYWLPSFWPAKHEHLQQMYNIAHEAFTSPFFLFAPYHGTLASGAYHMLKGDLGARGYQTVLATYVAGRLVDQVLAKPMAQAAAAYWTAKARTATNPTDRKNADFQRQRAERAHFSIPGYGTIERGVEGAASLLYGAARTGSSGAVRETLPLAASKVLQPVVTPGPVGGVLGAITDVVRGDLPLHKGLSGAVPGLVPYGLPPLSVRGEDWAQFAAQHGRFYPRYRLPSEQVAANFVAKVLPQIAQQAVADPQNKIRILRDAQRTMYALQLAAARDLQAAGLLPGSPEHYARQQTLLAFKRLPKPGPKTRLSPQRLQPARP